MIFGRAAVAPATPYESGGWVQLSQLDELTVICHDEFLEISINWRLDCLLRCCEAQFLPGGTICYNASEFATVKALRDANEQKQRVEEKSERRKTSASWS